LVRHSEIASHRGDVPLTDNGVEIARQVGRELGKGSAAFRVLTGGTLRTRQTAEAVAEGARTEGAEVEGPRLAFALRNPDMYAAGSRVNMVSSAAALAEQVPDMTAQQAEANAWWSQFFSAPDRIGWWLAQGSPPGETARDLTARVLRFAISLADPGPTRDRVVIGVTHSPVLRGLSQHATGDDPGEPGYVTGLAIRIADGTPHITSYDPLAPGADPWS
jgi:broad specificity phosphatase PhoE